MSVIRNIMKRTFLFLIIGLCTYSLKAQDTIYILYESDKVMTSFYGPVGKHKLDPDTRTHYPFDGGGMYKFEKKCSTYSRTLTFSYKSYTPEWMDYKFEYENVDVDSVFRNIDFIDVEWFKETDYDDILKTLRGNDKIIYLLDERYIKDKKGFLVRVHFNYDADE